jgi:DNA-binding CsgD family transcriptional regulator
MDVWTLRDSQSAAANTQSALAGMISQLGSPAFTTEGLCQLNEALQVGSWSVYRTDFTRPPVYYLSSSFRRQDTTSVCFQAYRNHLYKQDLTFDALGSRDSQHALKLLRLSAQEVSNPAHRHLIYERHQIRERLSVAKQCADNSILSVNLYRHTDQRGYGASDLEIFANLARPLFALVERQIALHHPARSEADALKQLAPDITTRELEVCVRLLAGMTHDGVACDLGISPTTVKTYRQRAFSRLGIHHNNELFALVLKRMRNVV